MNDMGVRLSSTSPVVAHEMVYLQIYDSARGHQSLMHLHTFDAQTGEPIWEYECERGLIREFAVAGADVFVISGGLEVIDARSGTRKWNVHSRPSALNGPPTITNEFVYLSYEGFPTWIENEPHQTGEMVVLERASRQELWSAKANEGQYTTDGAIVADDVLYTVWEHIGFVREGVTNATLFALGLRTGYEKRYDDARTKTHDLYPSPKIKLADHQLGMHVKLEGYLQCREDVAAPLLGRTATQSCLVNDKSLLF